MKQHNSIIKLGLSLGPLPLIGRADLYPLEIYYIRDILLITVTNYNLSLGFIYPKSCSKKTARRKREIVTKIVFRLRGRDVGTNTGSCSCSFVLYINQCLQCYEPPLPTKCGKIGVGRGLKLIFDFINIFSSLIYLFIWPFFWHWKKCSTLPPKASKQCIDVKHNKELKLQPVSNFESCCVNGFTANEFANCEQHLWMFKLNDKMILMLQWCCSLVYISDVWQSVIIKVMTWFYVVRPGMF